MDHPLFIYAVMIGIIVAMEPAVKMALISYSGSDVIEFFKGKVALPVFGLLLVLFSVVFWVLAHPNVTSIG